MYGKQCITSNNHLCKDYDAQVDNDVGISILLDNNRYIDKMLIFIYIYINQNFIQII